jgi:uncharacterized RDD family membrane protein YckC
MSQPDKPRMVTPEAVALEFTTANVGSRILGYVLDTLIVGIVSFLLILPLPLTDAALPEWLVVSILVIVIPGWYFGYFVVCETLFRGRTVGKVAMGLRVVTKEGGPVRFRHAAIRTLLGLVDFWILSGFFAVLLILLTRDNQRLGDIVAGTIVLRERSALPAAAPVDFAPPAGLESFAAVLDTSGMTGEQYQAVRTFLLRSNKLLPQARASLALQLADPLAARLRPPPPEGVQPEQYLQCVAAAYQRRQRPPSLDPSATTSQAWQTVAPAPEAGVGRPGGPWRGNPRPAAGAASAAGAAAEAGAAEAGAAGPRAAAGAAEGAGAARLREGGGREPAGFAPPE